MSNWIALPLAIAVFVCFVWVMKNRKNLKKAASELVEDVKEKIEEVKK